MKYLNDELGYLHYLKELSRFYEILNKGPNAINNFEMSYMTDFITLKKSDIKCSVSEEQGHRRKKQHISSKNQPNTRISISKEESDGKYQIVGDFTRKLKIRKRLLEQYQDYCWDEESFNTLITVIFDFEESLTEE